MGFDKLKRVGHAIGLAAAVGGAAMHAEKAEAITPAGWEAKMAKEAVRRQELQEHISDIRLKDGGTIVIGEVLHRDRRSGEQVGLYINGKHFKDLASGVSTDFSREQFRQQVSQALAYVSMEHGAASASTSGAEAPRAEHPPEKSDQITAEASPDKAHPLALSVSYADEATTRTIMATYGIVITDTEIRIPQDTHSADRSLLADSTALQLIVSHSGDNTIVITSIPKDGVPQILQIEDGQLK